MTKVVKSYYMEEHIIENSWYDVMTILHHIGTPSIFSSPKYGFSIGGIIKVD